MRKKLIESNQWYIVAISICFRCVRSVGVKLIQYVYKSLVEYTHKEYRRNIRRFIMLGRFNLSASFSRLIKLSLILICKCCDKISAHTTRDTFEQTAINSDILCKTHLKAIKSTGRESECCCESDAYALECVRVFVYVWLRTNTRLCLAIMQKKGSQIKKLNLDAIRNDVNR